MRRPTSKGACTRTGMNPKDSSQEVSDAGYVFLEHTADVGLRAWGPTPSAAFAAVARGMYAITLGRDPADASGTKATYTVSVSGATWADLLVNWLAELLFQFSVEGLVGQAFDFSACAPPRCSAQVTGCILDDEDEVGGGEIKAVTYHRLAVEVQPDRTTLRVIFDI